MRKLLALGILLAVAMTAWAQTDAPKKKATPRPKTVKKVKAPVSAKRITVPKTKNSSLDGQADTQSDQYKAARDNSKAAQKLITDRDQNPSNAVSNLTKP